MTAQEAVKDSFSTRQITQSTAMGEIGSSRLETKLSEGLWETDMLLGVIENRAVQGTMNQTWLTLDDVQEYIDIAARTVTNSRNRAALHCRGPNHSPVSIKSFLHIRRLTRAIPRHIWRRH